MAMSLDSKRPIDLETGWEYMEDGITKLKNILEGDKSEVKKW